MAKWKPQSGMSLQDAYDFAVGKIANDDWDDFARRTLNLDPNSDIGHIKDDYHLRKEQKIQMCFCWERKNGPKATVEKLYSLLNKYLKLDGEEGETKGEAVSQPSTSDISPAKHRVEMPTRCFDHSKTFQNQGDLLVLQNEKADEKVTDAEEEGDEYIVANTVGEKPKNFQRNKPNFCDRFLLYIPSASKEAYKSHSSDPSIYPVLHHPKGCVLIINNSFKGDPNNERTSSTNDVKNMVNLWESLGCELFEGKVHDGINAPDMINLVRRFAKRKKKDYDFVVTIIMSHGGEKDNLDIVYASDLTEVYVKDILDNFSNTNAKELQNIPKLFFFHFCRGTNVDHGAGMAATRGEARRENRLPTISDMLVAYSTHPDDQALANTKDGAWFINAITNVFIRYASSEHVIDMLTRVSDAMSEKEGIMVKTYKPCKSMSSIQSSLKRKLFLFPGFPNEK